MYTSIYSGPNFYVYLITDLNPIGTEKYYIGSSTRKELIEKNINPEEDTYFGSSTVEHFKILQKNQSPQLERIIVKTFSFKKECLDYEEKLQREYEAASNPLFYNLSYANRKYTTTSESSAKRTETINSDEWKATIGKEQRRKQQETKNSDEWKDTIGKEQRRKQRETVNSDEWKDTIGKDLTRKRLTTINSDEWKDTIGKDKIKSRQETINSDEWKNTTGLHMRQKRQETKNSEEWKATIGKEQIANHIKTINSDEWKNTTGLHMRRKQQETKNSDEWKATIGKEQIRKQQETKCGHKFYGLKGVGEFHTSRALHEAVTNKYGCSPCRSCIHQLAKTNFDVLITTKSFVNSPFLRLLKEDPVGKTYHEVGFYYYYENV